jgi:drug/metabolite transporter (DMT)-like permease
MFGIILGFATAIAFACNSVIARRGVLQVSSNYIANISILTGPVFSLIVALLTGHLYRGNRQCPYDAGHCLLVIKSFHHSF